MGFWLWFMGCGLRVISCCLFGKQGYLLFCSETIEDFKTSLGQATGKGEQIFLWLPLDLKTELFMGTLDYSQR